MPRTLTLDLPDLPATHALAARLAGLLRAGDAVLLQGPLGAGKSEFARAVLPCRNVAAVVSPTCRVPLDWVEPYRSSISGGAGLGLRLGLGFGPQLGFEEGLRGNSQRRFHLAGRLEQGVQVQGVQRGVVGHVVCQITL